MMEPFETRRYRKRRSVVIPKSWLSLHPETARRFWVEVALAVRQRGVAKADLVSVKALANTIHQGGKW